MPQFLFAVGFALRLTFGRRMQTHGSVGAYSRMIRRLLGLVLVSLVVYSVSPRAANWEALKSMGVWNALYEPLKRGWFQTLMHIAVTSLWLLPVVHTKPSIRIYWMIGSALAHVILSYWFNFVWCNTAPNCIDGGPLGFLTWTIPAIVGTLACDVFVRPRSELKIVSKPMVTMFFASVVLMALGYILSCGTRLYDVPDSQVAELQGRKLAVDPVLPTQRRIETKRAMAAERSAGISDWLAEPPFVKPPGEDNRKWNYWMMSQRSGTLSYPLFTAGFSLLVYMIFFIVCDLGGIQLAFFRTFGTNALIAYVLHSMVAHSVQRFFPQDSPTWYAMLGLALFFGITWMFVRHLEKQGAYLRV